MSCTIDDKSGKKISVKMGSYGIGVSRLVGGIIEANHDSKGIIWPKEVTPFMCSLINLNQITKNVQKSLLNYTSTAKKIILMFYLMIAKKVLVQN